MRQTPANTSPAAAGATSSQNERVAALCGRLALGVELTGFAARRAGGLIERSFLGLALVWMLLVAIRLHTLARQQ